MAAEHIVVNLKMEKVEVVMVAAEKMKTVVEMAVARNCCCCCFQYFLLIYSTYSV